MDIVFVAIILKNGICLEHYLDADDTRKINQVGRPHMGFMAYSVAPLNDDVLKVVGDYDVSITRDEIASISIKTYTPAISIYQTDIGQLICNADNIMKCVIHIGVELTPLPNSV